MRLQGVAWKCRTWKCRTWKWRTKLQAMKNARHENAGQENVCIEFVTSSRRLPTIIWNLNMLRIYPVELSRVELCRRCVHTRRLSWPSLQFCSVYVTVAENWKLGHDWRLVRSHRRQDATRLRCRQIVQTRRDSSRLSPTVANLIHTADATQLGSWGRRCVLGLWQVVCPFVRPSVTLVDCDDWWHRLEFFKNNSTVR